MGTLIRIIAGLLLLLLVGCALFREEYTTRYGLTNPEYPLVPPTPTDEAHPKGSIGQQYIEEYDKKYHEKGALSPAETTPNPQGQSAE